MTPGPRPPQQAAGGLTVWGWVTWAVAAPLAATANLADDAPRRRRVRFPSASYERALAGQFDGHAEPLGQQGRAVLVAGAEGAVLAGEADMM